MFNLQRSDLSYAAIAVDGAEVFRMENARSLFERLALEIFNGSGDQE